METREKWNRALRSFVNGNTFSVQQKNICVSKVELQRRFFTEVLSIDIILTQSKFRKKQESCIIVEDHRNLKYKQRTNVLDELSSKNI